MNQLPIARLRAGLILALLIGASAQAQPLTAYQNNFDAGPGSIAEFSTFSQFSGGVQVADGQLELTPAWGSSRVGVSLNTSALSGYSTVLSTNTGRVEWAFNVSNSDLQFNNGFFFIPAINSADPSGSAQGYAFYGGDMVGNRMYLARFDATLNGPLTILIDVPDAAGLAPLPEKASVRITFEPSSSMWTLYMDKGAVYTDPRTATTFLGSAVDDTYTHSPLPYLSMGGDSSGTEYFDNLSITIDPPAAGQSNRPPVLPFQMDRTISSLTHLVVTNSATDADRPHEPFTYQLANPPAGAAIDSQGIIRWTPVGVVVPSTNVITTIVTANETPNLSATNSFSVVVNDPSHLVFLPSQPDRILWWPAQLVVTNTATDLLIPPNPLSYQLINPPAGMTIDNGGVIRWTPSGSQVPGTSLITTVASDQGAPPLTATNSFTVVVSAAPNNGTLGILAGPIINSANHHPYFLLQPGSWTDAEATAVSMGGHLVTINDQEEQNWVRDTFSNYGGLGRALWTGLIDPEPSLPNDGSRAWIHHFVWSSGQPVTFFCWSSDSSIGSQGAGRIKMVQPDPPAGSDQCQWAEEADSTLLNAVVEIPLPLEIAAQPQSLSVDIGSEARFSVLADGLAPFSYQWQFNGTNLAGETRMTLAITSAQPSESGLYSVTVSNASGTITSAQALLSVVEITGWGNSPPVLTSIPAGLSNVVAISARGDHALGLQNDGTVLAWGLGYTNALFHFNNPIAVSAIFYGADLVLCADGTVWALNNLIPVPVNLPGLSNVVAIAAGAGDNVALRADGTMLAWNGAGLDNNLPPGLTNVVRIASGRSHSLALKADGTVIGWGRNDWGQATPPAGLTNVIMISTAEDKSMALTSDGAIVAWGLNANGEAFPPLNLTNVVAIDSGYSHSLALESDGTVVGWGEQAGITPAPSNMINVVSIAAGDFFSLALSRDPAPHLTLDPWDQTLAQGGSTPFFARAVGKSLAYQWQLNGANIAGATHDTCWVTNAQPPDGGLYTVVVSNQWGTAVSKAARLTVVYALTTQPPTLPPQADWVINTLTDLVVTNTASDAAVPNLVLSYRLLQPPAGATIDSQGIIRWRPGALQGGRTNWITTVVTDNGFPQLAATNSFTVIVNSANHAPVLPPQMARTISSITQLVVTNTAADPDIPANNLTYYLINPPLQASIDGQGIIRWTPSGAPVPGTVLITTAVTDDGTPNLSATNSFTVTVRDPASVLALPYQSDRTLQWPQQLVIRNTATNLLVPPDPVTYRLVQPPAGMTIDNQGIIRWTPDGTQTPSTNVITTVVTDLGVPPLSATNRFVVIVLPPPNNGPVNILAGPIVYPANGHQYFLLAPGSWSDAEATAVSMGGHLVTVNDQEEHVWVRDTFSNYGGTGRSLWVGMYDPNPAYANDDSWAWVQHFAWASGQPVTFFSWAVGCKDPTSGVGRLKMCAPDPTKVTDQCEWLEEADSTPLNAVVEVPYPLQIVQPPQSASVGIGSDTTLTVVADGTAPISYQWQFMGTNLPGATTAWLELLNVQPSQSGPYSVVLSNAYAVQTSAAAVLSVQGVVGWGIPGAGVFDIPATVTNVVALSAGALHALALRADGSVVTWGDNRVGQTNAPATLSNVVAIAAGDFFSLALQADGRVIGWGDDTSGQIDIPADLTNAVAIAAGGSHCLALRADGTLSAWGSNAQGESDIPAGLTNVAALAAGSTYSLALRRDGTVLTWGNYIWTSNQGWIPAYVPAGLTNVVAIAAGVFHSVALRSDGSVTAWGFSMGGDLDVPPGLANVVAISAGDQHTLALKADGTVVTWGGIMRVVPQPQAMPDVVAIASGGNFDLALLRDGAPHITVQPWDNAVSAGGVLTFSAKAVGVQSMGYQWQFNGAAITGATLDSYRISNAQPANAGTYALTVSNQLGVAVSRPVKLAVLSAAPVDTNPPPVLPIQSNRAINELSELVVTNTATDPGAPAGGFIYQLVSPPTGAAIDANGVIRWTPGDAQAPGTNEIKTSVIEAGAPARAATNSFWVTVNLVGPPVLPSLPDRMVSALSQLVVTNAAAGSQIPARFLSYQLVEAPNGATIDPLGVIAWTPGRAQGPSTNLIATTTGVSGVPRLSATNKFLVVVSAPTLVTPPNYAVNVGQAVTFTNAAADNDPVRKLSFSLGSAPPGAGLTPDTGIFAWRPPASSAGSTNQIQIRVADDSVPPVIDSRTFTVVVNPLLPVWLAPLGFSNGMFQLRINGSPGPDYILEATAIPTNWQSLQTNSPARMPFDFTDPSPKGATNRLYRVRVGP